MVCQRESPLPEPAFTHSVSNCREYLKYANRKQIYRSNHRGIRRIDNIDQSARLMLPVDSVGERSRTGCRSDRLPDGSDAN